MFTLTFKFERGKEDSIACINQTLNGLPLSNFEVRDGSGYFVTTTGNSSDGEILSVTDEYGFDSVSFDCEQNTDEEMFVYQLDACVQKKTDEACGMDEAYDIYHGIWSEAHPNHVIHFLMQGECDDMNSFVVCYRERSEAEKEDSEI